MTDNTLHTLYRPQDLDSLIGHTTAVTRLKGMIKTGKIPGAILFTGPSSVGKTTLARALAVAINGKPTEQQIGDYKELNAGDQRSIEDMRELIKLSKFRPSNKKRIFVIDEAQQIVTNKAACTAILKPLEDAGKTDSVFILCSMDPSKFTTGDGKAIANRCTQFVLEPHANGDLFKQAMRIVRGEKMSGYLDKELVKEVVRSSNSEMRTVANLLQGIRDYYEGLEDKPEALDADVIAEVLQSTESNDDRLVAPVIVGVLTGKYTQVQRALIDVADGFAFINKLMYCASYLLNNAILDGQRHHKVWATQVNREIVAQLKSKKITLGAYAALNECMVNVKAESASFSVGETALLSARLYRLIKTIFPPTTESK